MLAHKWAAIVGQSTVLPATLDITPKVGRIGPENDSISEGSGMASVWAELRRRNVFRVAAAYAVVSWLIIQVASALSSPLNLPEWFEAVVVALLAIGFPLSLLFAWAFDLTPDGIKFTQLDDAAAKEVGSGNLDYALIGALIVVAAVTLWGQLPTASVSDLTQPHPVQEAPSVAVLPFADMSPNGDQEYFGDGIAEELLNELTRLDGLQVAGRTSSFSFKQSDEDLQAIGEALRVNSILEGSIRKDGDRVRITAQLINAADGYHLWSDTYDRELTDIFAIQEEIARSVAGALGVRLGVGGVNAFRGAGTRNVEAYEVYLQGLNFGGPQRAVIRSRLFEQATQLDSNYAAAWAQLGLVNAARMWTALPEEAPALLDGALPLVRRAVELDPESAQAHSLLGTILYAQLDWIGGEEAHAMALSRLADRATLGQYANLLMRTGRSAAAQTQYDAAESAEPMGGRPDPLRVHASLAQARFDEAREIVGWNPQAPRAPQTSLDLALNEGVPEEIKTRLSAMLAVNNSSTALYSRVLSEFDSPELVLSTLRAAYADGSIQWPSKRHDIAMLAAYFSDPEFALKVKAEEVRNTPIRLFALWYPVMSEVRQLPEFKELVTDINLVAYWRAYGWADACRPLGENDFTCS